MNVKQYLSEVKIHLQRRDDLDRIALTMILIGCFCFYREGLVFLYIGLSFSGTALTVWNNRNAILSWFRWDSIVVWLVAIYGMFTVYGVFFLRAGSYNWDVILFRFIDCIGVFCATTGLMRKGNQELVKPFVIAGIFSLLFALANEHQNILAGSIRIGDSMSGNVNTAGYCFGLVSIFVTWSYCKNRKIRDLCLLAVLAMAMLLTGSKKVLIVLAADVVLWFLYEPDKKKGLLKLVGIGVVGMVVVFGIPYFYSIIGKRVIDMFITMFAENPGESYSHSTDVRMVMIQQGFQLFLDNPIFGGGMNYFYYASGYEGYSYTHCNYTEMLCNFGIVGTALYYSKYVFCTADCMKGARSKDTDVKDNSLLALTLLGSVLVLQWATVAFSEDSVWHFPVVIACVVADQDKGSPTNPGKRLLQKWETAKRLWKNDKRGIFVAIYNHIVYTGVTDYLEDETYLKLTYWVHFGKKLDLKYPKTFNGKLQWLKLYDRNPAYVPLVDKVLVKEYIAKVLGPEYVIPTLGVWDRFEDIDFDSLPNRFVLKCNHDSGSVVICKDKSQFDFEQAKKKLTKGLQTDAFYWGREWPYKNVERKIFAETFMENESGNDLADYKLMCFNGEVKCSFVCTDRFTGEGLHITFFDREWNVMPFERHYPSCPQGLPCPQSYEQMVALAEQLSQGIPFVRVDFYDINGKIYFGELTFYPGSGHEEFRPEEWDETLGSWIDLSLAYNKE